MSETKDHGAFLRDLEALAIKHNVVIGGCGCCGSPWLVAAPQNPEAGFYQYEDYLQFIHPSDEHGWERHGGKRP